MVTGVLPLALEDATKTIQAFLLTGKEYVCVMTMHGDVDQTRLRGVLEEFVGDIFQKPPVRAAVKRLSGRGKEYPRQVIAAREIVARSRPTLKH